MNIQVLLFGITRDIIGKNELNITVSNNLTVAQLKEQLVHDFNDLANYNYLIAVNETYADNDTTLQANDTVALIPPVSGG